METKIVASLAEPVGQHWRSVQAAKTKDDQFYVAAPLSSSPLPVYRWMIKNALKFIGWEAVHFVLMDEQVDGQPPNWSYISPEDPASYESFARRNILDPLRYETKVSLPVIKPELDIIETFTTPIDFLVLALGVKGNFANVMPGTPLSRGWHITKLIDEFKQVHTQADHGSYSGARFRDFGMSLGPQQVLEAGETIVIVSGSKKRSLYRELTEVKEFNPEFPLSVIYHPDVSDRVTVYVTTDVIE